MFNKKDKERKDMTPFQKVNEIVGNEDKSKFIIWYCTPEDQRPKFEDWKGNIHGKQWETCMNWLNIDTVIEGLQYYMNVVHKKHLFDIYMKTVNNAMNGDTKAIDLIFKNADNKALFSNENKITDEVNNIIDNLDIQ